MFMADLHYTPNHVIFYIRGTYVIMYILSKFIYIYI